MHLSTPGAQAALHCSGRASRNPDVPRARLQLTHFPVVFLHFSLQTKLPCHSTEFHFIPLFYFVLYSIDPCRCHIAAFYCNACQKVGRRLQLTHFPITLLLAGGCPIFPICQGSSFEWQMSAIICFLQLVVNLPGLFPAKWKVTKFDLCYRMMVSHWVITREFARA